MTARRAGVPRLLPVLPLIVGFAAGADAQRRNRNEPRPPPVAWQHAPPPAGSMVTRAERVERIGDQVVLDGYAQVAYAGLRVQADRIEIREDEQTMSATGNVVFERRNEKVVADSMTVRLVEGTAVFENARGILGQDFHFVAERVEEREDGSLVIEGGAFTTCAQPTPRWNFSAGRAVVEPNRHIWLRDVSFRVKDTPLAYFPAFYYPLEEDGRQSGFLIPRYGRSDKRGHLVSQAFYWAINRSMDATISLDHFTLAGTGAGTDYRYRGESGSRGDAQLFVINDKITENREYSLSFNVAQRLPSGFRLSAVGDRFSSFDFSQRFGESFARSTRRFQRTKLDLGGQLFRHRIKFKVDRKDTQYTSRSSRRETYPSLSLSRRNLNLVGRYVQLSYDASYVRVGRSRRDDFEQWNRLFLGPKLGISLPKVPFLDLRAEFDAGYLRYRGSKDPETEEFDPELSISNGYRGASVDLRGPKFERIFATPDNSYASRFKHLIEPEVQWKYRTSDEDFDLVNRFDRYDRSVRNNEYRFGIANRLLAKRYRDGVEEATATDLITWRIQQTWYIEPVGGAFDANYVSSSLEEESEVRKSPIRSNLRFTPDPAVNGDWTMEWNPDDRLFTSIRTGLRIGDRLSNRSFNFNWTRRARRQGGEPDGEIQATSFLRASGDFFPSEILRTGFDLNYDITERQLSNFRMRFDFLFQCCGVNAQWVRYNLGSRKENVFHFGITLAGITSFGFGAGGNRDRY